MSAEEETMFTNNTLKMGHINFLTISIRTCTIIAILLLKLSYLLSRLFHHREQVFLTVVQDDEITVVSLSKVRRYLDYQFHYIFNSFS